MQIKAVQNFPKTSSSASYAQLGTLGGHTNQLTQMLPPECCQGTSWRGNGSRVEVPQLPDSQRHRTGGRVSLALVSALPRGTGKACFSRSRCHRWPAPPWSRKDSRSLAAPYWIHPPRSRATCTIETHKLPRPNKRNNFAVQYFTVVFESHQYAKQHVL